MENNTIYVKFIDDEFQFRIALITIGDKATYFPIIKQLENLNLKPKKIISWKITRYTNLDFAPSKPTMERKHTLNTKIKSLKPRWA